SRGRVGVGAGCRVPVMRDRGAPLPASPASGGRGRRGCLAPSPARGGGLGWGQAAVCLSCGIAVPPPGLPRERGTGRRWRAELPPPACGGGAACGTEKAGRGVPAAGWGRTIRCDGSLRQEVQQVLV